MKRLGFTLVFLLSLVLGPVAQAQGPTPTPTPPLDENTSLGQNFGVDVVTMPFTIAPMPIPTVSPSQRITFTMGLAEMELMGNIAVTLLAFLDGLGVLPIIIIALMGLTILRWVYKFITREPVRGQAWDASVMVDALLAEELEDQLEPRRR
jgi:hypothetical protein